MSDFNNNPYNQETEKMDINDYLEQETGYSYQEMEDEDNVEIDGEAILEEIVGWDEFDEPKAGIGLEIGTFDIHTEQTRIIADQTYHNPAIDIIRTGEMVMIDLIFEKKTDVDLRSIWRLLNKYGQDMEASIKNNTGVVPIIRFSFVPIAFGGKHFVVAISPQYWALQPSTPTSEINTIRIVFDIDSIAFMEGDEYDFDDINAEIEREEAQREYIEYMAENERAEQEAYMEERNARLEEIRRGQKQ